MSGIGFAQGDAFSEPHTIGVTSNRDETPYVRRVSGGRPDCPLAPRGGVFAAFEHSSRGVCGVGRSGQGGFDPLRFSISRGQPKPPALRHGDFETGARYGASATRHIVAKVM